MVLYHSEQHDTPRRAPGYSLSGHPARLNSGCIVYIRHNSIAEIVGIGGKLLNSARGDGPGYISLPIVFETVNGAS
jgi:hypothetical protein